MSLDLTKRKAPLSIARLTVGAANVATEVLIPEWCEVAGFRFATDDGKVATEGDDGEAISVHYADSPAKALRKFGQPGKTPLKWVSFKLASATAGTEVEIIMEGR